MPAAVLVPLIVGGASTAATIYSTKKTNDTITKGQQAQTQAANQSNAVQQKAFDDALAFQKQMWGQQQQALQPYMRLGTNAVNTLNQWTGMGGGPTGFSNPVRASQPDLVQMRAPTGEVRPVPRAMVPHYQSRGGQVVN